MLNKSHESTFDSLVRLRSNRRSDLHERVRIDEIKQKVVEDINFLRDRIEHIKRSKYTSPNSIILQTYESMLESRESVLAWLQDSQTENEVKSAHRA